MLKTAVHVWTVLKPMLTMGRPFWKLYPPGTSAFFKKYVLTAEAVNYFSLSFGTPKLKNVH